MNVYEKLALAREKFHAAKVAKTGYNSFAKYHYFELADFTVPALAIFKDVGLVGVVSFGQDLAVLTIFNTEKPAEQIQISSPMSTCDMKGLHEVQRLGAVQSYLRRYLWVAALEIVEHDALDSTTGSEGKTPVKSTVIRPSEECFKSLQPEVQDFLRKAAPRVTAAMPDVAQVIERVTWVLNNYPPEDHNDIRAGLEWLLDSKTRSAIKAHEAAQ